MQEDRTSAMSLWTEAASYRDAARYLWEGIVGNKLKLPYVHPLLFLIGHSLEVVLKAKLRATGNSLRSLADHGHGLAELLDAAEKAGLRVPVSDIERDHLRLLDALHGKHPYQTRYPVTGFKQYPDHQLLMDVADRLIDLIKPDCNQALAEVP
jgi:hypothetical protein